MATFICLATGAKLSTNNVEVAEQYRKHPESYTEVKTTTKKAQPKQ